ncbi:hypothetical protein FACS189413_05810 [Bacteroidia bacterium]|nr:hypothetical protein FACS189413_05810 [Bacteroidia bacterium]
MKKNLLLFALGAIFCSSIYAGDVKIAEEFNDPAKTWTGDNIEWFIDTGQLGLSVTPGSGWGVAWSSNYYTVNLDTYPWIAVYMDEYTGAWGLKAVNGLDVRTATPIELPMSQAIVLGNNIFCWNVKDITGWSGTIDGFIQFAMTSSGGSIIVDWLRSYATLEEIEALPEASGGRPHINDEFNSMGDWTPHYNCTDVNVSNGTVHFAQGAVDGFCLFQMPSALYDLNAYPVLAVKIDSKSRPDLNFLMKLNNGAAEAVMRIRDIYPEEYAASEVYAWNLKEIWGQLNVSGVVISNIQFVIEGSTGDNVTIDWLRSFKDFDEFYDFIDAGDAGFKPNPVSDLQITQENKILHITGTNVSNVKVYNVLGGLVASTQSPEVNLQDVPNGMYIIKVNNINTFKVIVK